MPPGQKSINADQTYVDSAAVTLKEHIETRIHALEKRLCERFEAQERAVVTALAQNEKRLDSMNEFREALRDQNKQFITHADHAALITAQEKDVELLHERLNTLGDKIDLLNEFKAELKGKASQTQLNITFVGMFVSLVLGIIGLVLKLSGN